MGSPVYQYISTVNNKQGNELESHGTGRVHNGPIQNDESQYFETPRKTNCTYITNSNYKLKSTSSNKITLPPPGNKHFSFQTDGKTERSAQCYKSRALKNLLHSIFDVDNFMKQFVIIKSMLKSDQLIEQMATIGIYRSYEVYHYA